MKHSQLWSVHLVRIGILGCILLVVHLQHDRLLQMQAGQLLSHSDWSSGLAFFPESATIGDPERHGGRTVLGPDGKTLGYAIQTAPESDSFLGFSGPTNLLIAFDLQNRIIGVNVLTSGDTRDHVNLIRKHPSFLRNWMGLSWPEAAARNEVDGVAGATLTSLAMIQGIQKRLGAIDISTKFREPLELSSVKVLFPKASRMEQDSSIRSLWHAYDDRWQNCGSVLRTSPAADEIIGYQGPTECRIGILPDGKIVGVTISASFDNEPYVGYVKQDAAFEKILKKYSIGQWKQIELEREQIEGVSGATMTSMAVAQGLIAAAARYESERVAAQSARKSHWTSLWRGISTLAIVGFGLIIGLSSLRGNRRIRITFQIVVIVYLGLINGDLLSMAMFAGWAQSGIPWQNALGLVVLAFSALVLPIVSRSNIYCSHLCPHGAVQQLLPRRWKMKTKMPTYALRILNWIRPGLIAWVILVTLLQLPYNLVDIEPFDAYSWRSASWPTVLVALLGIAASLRVPMAYCRFGCGTGAILQYLRRHSRSDQLTRADLLAVLGLVVGILIYVLRVPS